MPGIKITKEQLNIHNFISTTDPRYNLADVLVTENGKLVATDGSVLIMIGTGEKQESSFRLPASLASMPQNFSMP